MKTNRKVVRSVICVLLALIFVVSLMTALIPVNASAASQSEINQLTQQRKELQAKQKEQQKTISNLRAKKASIVEQKAALDQEMNLAQQEIEVVKEQITAYDQQIEDKGVELEAAKQEEEAQTVRFRGCVRHLEEYGQMSYIAILLEATSLSDLLARMDMVGEVIAYNKQVQADILSAVGRILQEKDFTHITLMDIAREAKTDPNVVLRQFGSLEQVFDCYIRTIDYWMHDLFGNKALKRGERSALERMFARMTDFLYNSPEMQRLLVWEITDVNDTTCRAAANRETYYREAYEAYERQFARGGEKTPFRQIASLLIAGTYYLVLHRHTSTFGDMDYDTPDGPVRLKKVLHEILDMLYERLERPQRVSEAIRRLKERGVDEQVIRECLKDL